MSEPRNPNDPDLPPSAEDPTVVDSPTVGEPTSVQPAAGAGAVPPGTPPPGDEAAGPLAEGSADEEREDRRAAIAIVAVLALAVVVALLWWLLSDDEDDQVDTVGTTTTEQTTTSTTEPTTTQPTTTEVTDTTGPPPTVTPTLSDAELATAVWPDQGSSRRFDDPNAAARAFATDFLGFPDPVLGQFAQGDQRSGEVEVRAQADGPVTTVLVRQLGDDTWWVLGAQASDIRVTEPGAGATISSPALLEGTARAFEGTVEVEVRRDGGTTPIGSGFVTGGATGELQPFSGEIGFDAGDAEWGAVVFRTTDAATGQERQATVVRVAFG